MTREDARFPDLRYFVIKSEAELKCLVSMPYEVYLWFHNTNTNGPLNA